MKLVEYQSPIRRSNSASGLGKGTYRDDLAVVNSNWPKAAASFMEVGGGKIEEAPDLVLRLEHITPVPTGLNWAVGAGNSVLPRVQSLLYAIPAPTTMATKFSCMLQKP